MAETLKTNTPEATTAEVREFEQLQTKHGTFTTIVTDAYKNRKRWERPDPKKLHAFIPGTITMIEVKIGDKVSKGDVLLRFNAMKMANTLSAPFDGTIKAIGVQEGEIVPNGKLLIEFE
ncbi:MAG: acetyl-CoA carboxylase biotin carboxyl carrier protein subunit [Rikenellaceae bacterium]